MPLPDGFMKATAKLTLLIITSISSEMKELFRNTLPSCTNFMMAFKVIPMLVMCDEVSACINYYLMVYVCATRIQSSAKSNSG